ARHGRRRRTRAAEPAPLDTRARLAHRRRVGPVTRRLVRPRTAEHIRAMRSRASIEIPAMPPESALPRQAMWVFLLAPPLLALLFDPNCVMTPDHVVRALVALTLYTVVTGLAVHLSFEWLAAKLRPRGWPILARVAGHGALCAVVVALVTAAQLPLT